MLNNGANIDAKSHNGYTPIMFATEGVCVGYAQDIRECSERLIQNISYFLKKGALLAVKSDDDMNLLHIAARSSRSPEMVLFLIDKKVDHKAKDKSGKVPMDYIKENNVLKGSKAYWKLHDLSFD